MFSKTAVLFLAVFVLFSMAPEAHSQGLVRLSMPEEDPGPPFYARVGLQILESDRWVAIPFYRAPECVPPTFNLLDFYDFPGPNGPGAFACPLLTAGFLLIESDAPLGTFPKRAVFNSSGTPIWFVNTPAFHAATRDGVLTMGELEALRPLLGLATRYHETLLPRGEDHRINISAEGMLDDGGSFSFHVVHIGDRMVSIDIDLK